MKCEGSVCGGQSYWKTSDAALVVTEQPTNTVCGVVSVDV